nr:hypothetical protein [Nocardioides mesophilus]
MLEGRCHRLEGDAGGVGSVREQPALAAGLGHGAQPDTAQGTRTAQELQRLGELLEVLDLDHAVAGEGRGERGSGPDDGARVGQGDPGSGHRSADLETDHRLSPLSALAQGLDEGRRATNRLQEQPDGAGRGILGEVVEEVGDVSSDLAPRGDDRTEADPGPHRGEGLGDGPRLRDDRDAAGQERVGQGTDPR